MNSSMYFKYGNMVREGLPYRTCWDAAKAGARTSTTRFRRDSERMFKLWKECKPGTDVVFWSGPWDRELGRFSGTALYCITTSEPEMLDLRTMNEDQKEAWSKVEGWSAKWIDWHLNRGGDPIGLQIRYRLKQLE